MADNGRSGELERIRLLETAGRKRLAGLACPIFHAAMTADRTAFKPQQHRIVQRRRGAAFQTERPFAAFKERRAVFALRTSIEHLDHYVAGELLKS